jgi:hypothetical protein
MKDGRRWKKGKGKEEVRKIPQTRATTNAHLRQSIRLGREEWVGWMNVHNLGRRCQPEIEKREYVCGSEKRRRKASKWFSQDELMVVHKKA